MDVRCATYSVRLVSRYTSHNCISPFKNGIYHKHERSFQFIKGILTHQPT